MDIEYRGFEVTNTAGAEIIRVSGGFKTGEWVYGYPLVNKVEGKSYIVTVTQNGGYIKHEVIPETMGPLALVAPFNDTKIYLGDYVKVDDGCVGSPYERSPYWLVTFEEGSFWLEEPGKGGVTAIPIFNECAEYTVAGSLWNKPDGIENTKLSDLAEQEESEVILRETD